MVGEKWIKLKDDSKEETTVKMNVTVERETKVMVSTTNKFDAKTELLQVSEVIKQTNEKMKASFKSIKNLMRGQHFQTHIQFPVESLILHLEQFLSLPTNSSEDDLQIMCKKTLPNEILKNLELMIKDNFLIHQSDLNPEIFAKLEKGISLMIKQLIFAQSVCLQIRHFDSTTDVQKIFGFHMAKNIEFYIKKQRMVIISKNRYFKEIYNGWKIYAFYPKFTLKHSNRIQASVEEDAQNDNEDEERKTKTVIKNQIIFECKNEGHCTLSGNDKSGIYNNGQKSFHYSICGNIGITIGHPIHELRKFEELSVEEKAEQEKWEKTKAELTKYLKDQKLKDLEEKEIQEKKNEELIEATIFKVLREIKAKNEIQTAALVSTNGNGGEANLAFVTFPVFIFYLIL
uniref:Uncharacterized protein n=1 Tax=Panagrolaimus davidi TaxID=227884 RepID=A0A914PWA9_9BILA